MKLLIASIEKSQGVNSVRDPEVQRFETNSEFHKPLSPPVEFKFICFIARGIGWNPPLPDSNAQLEIIRYCY